jgi:hypothetical protein
MGGQRKSHRDVKLALMGRRSVGRGLLKASSQAELERPYLLQKANHIQAE